MPSQPHHLTDPTTVQTRLTLTDEQIAYCRAMYAASDKWELYYETIWRCIIGDEAWEAAIDGKLNPRNWALPSKQWKELMSWIVERVPVDIRTTVALTWVNIGPSAYED